MSLPGQPTRPQRKAQPTEREVNKQHSLGDLGSLLVLRRLAELNRPAPLGEVEGAQRLRHVVGRRTDVDEHHHLRVTAQGVLERPPQRRTRKSDRQTDR